jgi:transposase InsO family protein
VLLSCGLREMEREARHVCGFSAGDRALDRRSEIFYSPKEAQVVIEMWRKHYNTVRPHSSLGYRAPAPLSRVAAA